jgi:hypothetical protein
LAWWALIPRRRLSAGHSDLDRHHVKLGPDKRPDEDELLIEEFRPRLYDDRQVDDRAEDIGWQHEDADPAAKPEICDELSCLEQRRDL